jgi:GntR family transcriptional regulator
MTSVEPLNKGLTARSARKTGDALSEISYSPNIPLHHQIQQLLRARIANQDWGVGERIPTEAQLRDVFGVSRTTIRLALTPLVREGLLVRRRSHGTFVNKQTTPNKRCALTVANQVLGYRASNKLIAVDTIRASSEIAALLRIDRASRIRKFIRVELSARERIAVVLNFVPLPIAEKVHPSHLSRRTMIECLRDSAGLLTDRVEVSIQATMPNEEISRHLRYELGRPVLFLRMVVYEVGGQPIQVADSYFRSDRVRFEHVLEGMQPSSLGKTGELVSGGKIAVSGGP